MKTFSRILSEVAQPSSEDELNFKQKHIIDPIDHTVAPESTFSGAVDKDDIDGMKRYRKNKRLADYQRPDDEDVYEAVTLKRDIPGQEDSDVDNDGDSDMTDAQYKYRKHAQIKKYKIDETWSDGISSRNAHMHARTAATYRKKANDSAAIAKQHDKGSPEHSRHMVNYHSAMAKSIKSSYHAGDYGSVNTAKRDHKAEMDKAKEYRSSMSEGFKLDETVYVIPEEILATEKNAFHTAAANAHATGKKHFAFAGKKYPVTMSKDAAKTFAGKGGMSEGMDPVGKEDDDINNDGKVNKSDKYLHARRKAISASIRTKIKEGFGAVTAAGGDYDEEESHARYKKSNLSRKENVTLSDGKGLKIYAGKTRESQIDEEVSFKKTEYGDHHIHHNGNPVGKIVKTRSMGSSGYSVRIGGNTSKHEVSDESSLKSAKDSAKWHLTSSESPLKKESVELDEAVEVRHDRYMRSHGKKARDSGQGSGTWMFTHKDRGDVDYNNKKEVHTARGKFSDAKKSAQQWAKENGHHSVYVMEEVEQIDEISKDTLRSYAAKSYNQANTLVKQSLSDQPKSVQKASTAAFKRRSGGIKAAGRRLGSDEMKKIHADVVREEVEQIDELKKSTLGSYVRKASVDAYRRGQDTEYHTAARDATDNYGAKRRHAELTDKARSKASNRIVGIEKATQRLAKEEVEQIDELKKSTLASYVKKSAGAGVRNSLPNAMKDQSTAAVTGDREWYKKSGRTATNRSTGIQRAADRLAKEDINEAFSAGSVKLNDGSSISVKPQDAKLLNQLMDGLKPENAKKMLKVAMTDKHGFNEILGFAREAL